MIVNNITQGPYSRLKNHSLAMRPRYISSLDQEVPGDVYLSSYQVSEVIYGDTDSVMIKFGPKDLPTVMALGK